MKSYKAFWFIATASSVAFLVCSEASAIAISGGAISTAFVSGFGLCNKNSIVPLTTPQDTFVLNQTATCTGGSASGDLHAETASGSAGLRLTASGDAQIAAQVALMDNWLINVAPGTAPGIYTLPVTFNLHGSVSPGSFARLGNFLTYNMSARDVFAGFSPTSVFQVTGSTSVTGVESQTFNGSVDFRYFGPGSALPPTVEIAVSLFAPQLQTGTIDYFNTASVSLILPSGWSATTSSGLPVVFAAVPEPTTYAMLLAGLGFIFAARVRHLRRTKYSHRNAAFHSGLARS